MRVWLSIIGEVDPQPSTDLLRAPRHAPAPVRPAAVTSPLPRHVRSRDRPTSGVGDRASESCLDIVAQLVVGGERGSLGAPGGEFGIPRDGARPPRLLMLNRWRIRRRCP